MLTSLQPFKFDFYDHASKLPCSTTSRSRSMPTRVSTVTTELPPRRARSQPPTFLRDTHSRLPAETSEASEESSDYWKTHYLSDAGQIWSKDDFSDCSFGDGFEDTEAPNGVPFCQGAATVVDTLAEAQPSTSYRTAEWYSLHPQENCPLQ